jgi:hypothetical protein
MMRTKLLAHAMRVAAAIVVASSVSLTVDSAQAKAVKGVALGAAIDACLLANDAQTGESSTKFGCCSHEAGICVICPKPPSANNACEVTPYRTNGLSGFKHMLPDTLNGMQMMH